MSDVERAPREHEEPGSYVRSMPDAYRSAFDARAVARHAAIVAARPGDRTHVAVWDALDDGTLALCVVADDHPGLLSRITAALVACDMDVVEAEAYCRLRKDGRVEAVDFLRIRRTPAPTPEEIAALGTQIDVLASRASLDEPRSARRSHARGTGATRVRFGEDLETGATVLTIEARDRPGLLLAVTRTLFLARLQIVALHARTHCGRASDAFHVTELDGSRVGAERLLALQSAILGAVDEA